MNRGSSATVATTSTGVMVGEFLDFTVDVEAVSTDALAEKTLDAIAGETAAPTSVVVADVSAMSAPASTSMPEIIPAPRVDEKVKALDITNDKGHFEFGSQVKIVSVGITIDSEKLAKSLAQEEAVQLRGENDPEKAIELQIKQYQAYTLEFHRIARERKKIWEALAGKDNNKPKAFGTNAISSNDVTYSATASASATDVKQNTPRTSAVAQISNAASVFATPSQNPFTLYQRGVEEFKQGKPNTAKELVAQALELFNAKKKFSVEAGRCHATLGSCERDLRQTARALSHFELALIIYEMNHQVTRPEKENLVKKYFAYLKQIIDDKPNILYNDLVKDFTDITQYIIAKYKLLFLIQTFPVPAKLSPSEDSAKLSPLQMASCYLTLASCHEKLGDLAFAKDACDKAQAHCPKNLNAALAEKIDAKLKSITAATIDVGSKVFKCH